MATILFKTGVILNIKKIKNKVFNESISFGVC